MAVLDFFKSFYTIFFVWIAGLAAAFSFRKPASFPFRVFASLIIFITVMETAANIMAFNGRRNHFLFNIFEPVNFFTIAYFYTFHLHHPFLKKTIHFFLCIFPLFVVTNTILIQSLSNLNTNSYVFGGSFILLLSVVYLWQLYNSYETHSIFRDPVFWISIANLFYFAISVPYLGMLNFLYAQYPEFTREYYEFVYQGAIIGNKIFLTTAFL